MFRGFNTFSLDSKGRLAIPRQYREYLSSTLDNCLIVTLNPLDRAIWLYPLTEWEHIETKLAGLSDFDRQGRRAKQMMRGYASDCRMDGHGRILIPQELRDYAQLKKQVVVFGQGNKFEIWDESAWVEQREQWLQHIGEGGDGEPSDALKSLSL